MELGAQPGSQAGGGLRSCLEGALPEAMEELQRPLWKGKQLQERSDADIKCDMPGLRGLFFLKPGIVVNIFNPFNPSTPEGQSRQISVTSEASLDYVVSSKTARTTTT